MTSSVRPTAVAGRFYSGNPAELREFLDRHMNHEAAEVGIRGVIAPHAGYVYSGATAAKAYSRVKPDSFDRTIVLAPSHRAAFQGLSIAPHDAYSTPLGELPVDSEAVQRLLQLPHVQQNAAAHRDEHALEVQLPFIQHLNPAARLLPILVGALPADGLQALAEALAAEWGPRTLLAISSDFTHYGASFGYLPFPPDDARDGLRKLDHGAIERIEQKAPAKFTAYVDKTGATICGRGPIRLMLEMVNTGSGPGFGPDAAIECIDYTTSGEVTGDFNSSVSYAGLIIRQQIPQPDRELLLGVAREAIHARLHHKDYTPPATVPHDGKSMLLEPGASFVTLRINEQLRGCIGSLQAREILIRDVARNAVNAAFQDPRFPPLGADEYEHLDYHISVLTPATPVDSYRDIVLGRHGIILQNGPQRAVFLPSVATEQGWNLETTLQHLSRKAGLSPDSWRQANFSVFEAISITPSKET